jgi:predicted amidohydrolase YtcJ
VDRYTAVHAFTAGAAHAAGLENETGSLAPGMRANFLIVDKDVMTVPDHELLDVCVLATFVAGKPLYASEKNAPQLIETLNSASV